MGWVLVVLGIIIVGIAFYAYYFLKRAFTVFGLPVKRKWVKTVNILLAILIALLCANPFGFSMVIILHVLAIAALFQLVNFIVKKTFGKKHSISLWEKIYGSGILPIFFAALILFGGYLNLHHVVRTDYTVYTDKDIRAQGYRIVLIADVHFGVSLDEAELWEKCKEISSAKPDIVILCGDIVDNSTTYSQMHSVFSAFGSIESKLGIYYVHGNHDRPMSLVKSAFSEKELEETILANGITILQDDVLPLAEDLTIVGREDRSAKSRRSLEQLFEKADQNDFILTLDHQPNQYKENGKIGTNLLLSGHTHGGQLFPIDYIQEWIPFNDGVYGRYDIDGDTVAIITAGFATWSYPSKTAAPAEYVVIDIKPSE
ncbi:MAG: hypothetical protein E7616_04965 [Ruminococcaceae bacterium]|nr:hypothetical protein [Oscillospiraceae bacterium]